MPTTVRFFQRAIEAPGTCAKTCVVDYCPYTVPIATWLNSILTTHQNAEVLDYRFQINPDSKHYCIFMVAQVRYKI